MRPDWLIHRVQCELRRHRGAVVLLGVGFGLAALLLGTGRLVARAAGEVAPALRGGAHVIAYLDDDVGGMRAEATRDALGRLAGVVVARLVSSDEALERLRAQLGSDAPLLDGLEAGFLPGSIEVSLDPGPGVAARAEDLARRLAGFEGVAQVDSMGPALERLASALALARSLGRAALALAVLAAAAALALAVHVGRDGRQLEGEILAFLGETPIAARVPGALTGALAAGTAAAVAAGVLYLGYRLALGPARAALAPLIGGVPPFLPAAEIAAGCLLAAALGAVAGGLAARAARTIDAAV